MKITERINFKQPKYMLPAIIYLPMLLAVFLIIRLFNTETAEVGPSNLETTDYLNTNLPEANIKGDGIGDKYTNMLNDFGKIKDASAVENIESTVTQEKQEYTSQYSDAELAAMDKDSKEAQESMEKLRRLQEQMQEQSLAVGLSEERPDGNTAEEDQTLEELRAALDEARSQGRRGYRNTEDSVPAVKRPAAVREITVNENAVQEISEETVAEEVVKVTKETSDYFNTISENEPEQKLIKAIVDEDVKAVDGSRVRLRLLDDINIGDRIIEKGSYLYCIMSSFSKQRIQGTVKSVLVEDELVKVNLKIYDTDGMEGLYVPRSAFRETAQDVAGGAMSQSMNINDGTSTSNASRWGWQAIQNAVQKTTNAISKNIRQKKVKIKYGTQVYLVNSREKRQKNNQ